MRFAALVLCVFTSLGNAQQQPNGVLLVAKPGLADPNFRQTVVLVTQTEDAHTVGVILNRPSEARMEGHGEPLYSGGPVMARVVVALFEADEPPPASAFRILKRVWLTMHPDNLSALLARPPARLRLYSGFSGWAPRQLESELARGGWYVLPAREAVIFRKRTENMWRELLEEAQSRGRKKPA